MVCLCETNKREKKWTGVRKSGENYGGVFMCVVICLFEVVI
jgi:hypothetical protein